MSVTLMKDRMLRRQPVTGLSPAVALYRDILLCFAITIELGILFSTEAYGFLDQQVIIQSVSSDLGNPFEQAITLFIFANSVILARLGRISARTIAFSIAPLVPILLLALASFLWSDFPLLTIRRASRLVIETTSFFLLALSYRDEPDRVLRLLFGLFAVLLAANIASLALPSKSFTPIGFRGIFGNKNYFGFFCFFAIPVFAIGIVNPVISKSRLIAVALIVITAGLMPIAGTKTAMVCIPLGILLTLSIRFVSVYDARIRGILFVIYTLAALAIVISAYDTGIDTLFDKLFGDVSLTGRDNIWRFALDRFSQRPLLGVGFGALWQTGPDVIKVLVQYNAYSFINEAHNGYIDILAQLGLTGLALTIAFLIIVFVRLIKAVFRYEIGKNFGIASYGMYLLLGSIIYNFTESAYLLSHEVWIMLVFVTTCATAYTMRNRAPFPHYQTIQQLKLLRANRES